MLLSTRFICLRVAYREAFWEELSRLIWRGRSIRPATYRRELVAVFKVSCFPFLNGFASFLFDINFLPELPSTTVYVWGQDGWILAKFFFLRVYAPRRSRGQWTRKKRTRPISSHLDRTNLVNKGFIAWLSGKFFLRGTAGSPERARWLDLVRSGSQSQRAIWFILPARGASHIVINN